MKNTMIANSKNKKKPVLVDVPPPPPPKKIFGNVTKRRDNTQFFKDMRAVLFVLRESITESKPALAELVVRFVGHIRGPKDETVLPVVSADGKSKRKDKAWCVAAVVSHAILQGWKYQAGDIEKEEAYQHIEAIKEIAKVSLNNYKVEGNAKGYYLKGVK